MNSADERVWDLLQTIDLENLDITTFQGVAAPIFAQKENKEALEALALIAFARMARQGEFNGWLNAGGGSGGISIAEAPLYGVNTRYNLHKIPPYFSSGAYASYNIASLGSRTNFYPFLAPATGTISEIGMEVTTASSGKTLLVGIYESGDQGLPTNLLGECAISLSSIGAVYQTSITGTISVEKNTQYYIGYVRQDGSTNGAYTGPNDDGVSFAMSGLNAVNDDPQRGLVIGATGTTTFNLDATYSGSSLFAQSAQGLAPAFTVKIT